MAIPRTHYDNLKVARNAPDAIIRGAYKVLMQNYHPDKFEGTEQEALRITKLIKNSYDVLIDPIKRANHDRWIDEQQIEDAQFSEVNEEQHYQKQNTQRESTPPPQPPPESKQSKGSTPIYSWLRWVVFAVCSFVLLLVYAGWRTYDHNHAGSGVGGFLRGVVIFVPLAALWGWAKSGNKPKASSQNHINNIPQESSFNSPGWKGWLFWIGSIFIVIWLYAESGKQNTALSQQVQQATPSIINNPSQYIVDEATSRTTPTQEPRQQGQQLSPSSTNPYSDESYEDYLARTHQHQAGQPKPYGTDNEQDTKRNSDEDIYKRATYFRRQGMYAEALPLYRQLVEHDGYSGAQIELGGMYENGEGVTQDYTQAIYWYRKASETVDVNQEIAKAALNKLISITNKKSPRQIQTQTAQAQQTKPSQKSKAAIADHYTESQIITDPDKPDLSRTNTEQQQAIERACDSARQYMARAAYYDCLSKELAKY